MKVPTGIGNAVADLGRYRERKAVRRLGAYALVGIAGLVIAASMARLREELDWIIRKAAELLPEDEPYAD